MSNLWILNALLVILNMGIEREDFYCQGKEMLSGLANSVSKSELIEDGRFL